MRYGKYRKIYKRRTLGHKNGNKTKTENKEKFLYIDLFMYM